MKLFDRLKNFVVRRLSLTDPDGWSASGHHTDSGELVNAETALSLSAVWGCVNLIAGTISSLPLMVYRTNAKGFREVARGHTLYRLLHDSPNFDQTALDFWEFMAATVELWGNAYARKVTTRGVVTSLVPVAPSLMSVRRLTDGTLEYRWSEDGKSYIETDRTIFHIRGFGGNPLGGMSTLHYGRNALGLARSTDKAASTAFKNAVRPSGALNFAEFLTPEQRAIATTTLVEQFVGAANTGKPMVLEGGTTWSSLTIKPSDAQMLESRGFSVEEICRFFDTPPFMIGHTTKTSSWPTSLEQQIIRFVVFTLRRRLKRIEQAAQKQLLSPQERAEGLTIEFNLEGLLRGDSKARASFYQAGLLGGWLTINEVRAKENLPPVEGGDVVRMQMQNVPITEFDDTEDGGMPDRENADA